ncbi:MAG: AI-2E family transporter [Ruminococcaceae bacterium]|nr:AI-2E family transporter [Oscillospiraceae bacterium]
MKTETWVRLAAIGVCTVTAGVIGYVLARYFAGILLPFLGAALIASVLRPAAARLRAHTRIPEKLGGTILIISAAVILSVGVFALGEYVYESALELVAVMMRELEEESGPLHGLATLSGRLRTVFPAEEERFASLYGMASEMLREGVSAASSALTGAAASVIVGLPRVLLSAAVGVIALFYLFFDAAALREQMRFFLSDRNVERISGFFIRIREALGGCLRAYALLLFLTFSELLAGFLLMDVENALPAALLTALVDILPVFGVGTVLVPWSILAFLSGNMFRGTGMLILFGVMTVVRQFAEPRIVGGSLGIHPLITLLAVFAGYRLCGIAGMLAAPILLYALKAALPDGDAQNSETRRLEE